MREVALTLADPPEVARVGVAVHGVQAPRDVWLLPDLWQLHLYDYSAQVTLLGETHLVVPGSVSLVPPNTEVAFDYRGPSEHLFAHFRTGARGRMATVPVVQHAGPSRALITELMRQAVKAFPSGSPRVAAELWSVLWRVVQMPPTSAPSRPADPVSTALAHIEANLARPLPVPALAAVAGVSHNHLTRLFNAETGRTVVGYIRHRRMAMARHLLTSSTLSIPSIAATVGIDDLQAFNKACRRELGGPPRAIRAGTAGITPRACP